MTNFSGRNRERHLVCITHLAIKREKGANCFTNEPLQVFLANKHQEELEEWKNVPCVMQLYSLNDLTLMVECFAI